MSRLGIAFSGGLTPAETVECIRLAEVFGYHSAWVTEGHGGDQFAILAAAATQTRRITLGTSISSVFVRSLPTLAMAAATLDDLSGHRFVLGLGSSHKAQVEPEHGIAFERPIARLRDAVAVTRALLREGVVSHAGETVRIERFDLWFEPPRREIPIYLAAVFPRMIETAAALSDGVMLTRTTLDWARLAARHAAIGAERSGREPGAVRLVSLLPCCVAKERREAIDLMRPGVAFYGGFFPRYNRLLAESGFPEAAAAIREAWRKGEPEAAAAAVPDGLVESTGVVGTAEACRERLGAYRAAGIDLPVISPFARGADGRRRTIEAMRACIGQ